MPYWGKIVGIIAGLATGRPWLALLGLVLGHQFDRGFAKRFSYFERDSFDARFDRLPEGFVKALFQTMGYLAKADGRVTRRNSGSTRTDASPRARTFQNQAGHRVVRKRQKSRISVSRNDAAAQAGKCPTR